MTANRTARRELTLAVVACVVAAGLALFAASRTWVVEVRERPAPLPAVSTPLGGGDLAPVLPSLAFVALAGASGLVATRGRARSAVAVLLIVAGLGMATAAVAGAVAGGGPGEGGMVEAEPLLALWAATGGLAGVGVAAVGALALRRGRAWPAMGSTYERRPRRDPNGREPGRVGDHDMWDALDRRIDPTGDNTSHMDD